MNEKAIADYIYRRVAELADAESRVVDAGTTLESVGIDSSDAVILAMEVEEFLMVEVDPGTFMRHPTLGEAIHELAQLVVKPTATSLP